MIVTGRTSCGMLSVRIVTVLMTLFLSAIAVTVAATTTTTSGGSGSGSEQVRIRGATVGTDSRERRIKSSENGTKMIKKEKDYSKDGEYGMKKLTKKDGGKGDFKKDVSVYKSDKKMAKEEKNADSKKMIKKGKADKIIEGMEPTRTVQPVILDTDYGPFIDDGKCPTCANGLWLREMTHNNLCSYCGRGCLPSERSAFSM
jgi:hypothetical protein